jgi:hypothetical protein
MIYTGTLTVLTRTLTGYDEEGMPIYSLAESDPIDSNFQNKPNGELNFAQYGLNEREDNKYIFCEYTPLIKMNTRIRNDNTGKVYEVVKPFDGYPDNHMEIIVKPVVGE